METVDLYGILTESGPLKAGDLSVSNIASFTATTSSLEIFDVFISLVQVSCQCHFWF